MIEQTTGGCPFAGKTESLTRRADLLTPGLDITARGTLTPDAPARAFRDATQLGRKRAIQIIECFDRLGYTRRVRDAHVLRPDAQWHPQA